MSGAGFRLCRGVTKIIDQELEIFLNQAHQMVLVGGSQITEIRGPIV
jgi:hypothetical protein